jgi:hypothetical protein
MFSINRFMGLERVVSHSLLVVHGDLKEVALLVVVCGVLYANRGEKGGSL